LALAAVLLLPGIVSGGPATRLTAAEEGINGMHFVNEYATDEDIGKYRLHEIWDRYLPMRKGRYYSGYRPDFTIDRDADVFLMRLEIGHGTAGNLSKFLLYWQGAHVLAYVRLVDGSSQRLNEQPFYRVWKLETLKMPSAMAGQRNLIIDALKRGLETFGYWGAQQQIANTVTKFDF
jgi:hypothetical protein